MTCPCIRCEKNGCGPEHDSCHEYQKFRNNRLDINKKRKADSHRLNIGKKQPPIKNPAIQSHIKNF